MSKLIAVFRSKTDLFSFINDLKSGGVIVETVQTPKEARIGCGLSAKFDERFYRYAVTLLNANRYDSFYAIYKVTADGGRISTVKVYF